MSKRAVRHRNICFTINAKPFDFLRLLDFEIIPEVSYAIYQRELGAREHFQGYMELCGTFSFSTMHEWPGFDDAHFESRRGPQRKAIDYCCKPNDSYPDDGTRIEGPWLFGSPNAQGQRTELLLIQRELNEGATLARIAQDHFVEYIRFHRSFSSYQLLQVASRNWPMDVHVYIGPTGCGKTRRAYDTYGESIFHQAHGKWFDGYAGQETVLVDEFEGCDRFSWSFLLQLTDRYPMSVEVKGGVVPFVSRRIIFTSNNPIELWYPLKETSPFLRRVTRTVVWSNPPAPTFLQLIDGHFVPVAQSRSLVWPQ